MDLAKFGKNYIQIAMVSSLLVFLISFLVDPPKFEEQILDSNVSIGYGLAVGDVDGDKKPDILLADKKEFVWYRNGDWKRIVMIENLTQSDNVCIAARDINGDGKVEVAVGAQWNPNETTDTLKSGSVHYLVRPNDPTQLWTAIELHHEPTIHRMKWVRTAKNQYQLVVLPLHGRGNKNGEGDAVKVFSYGMPDDPKGKWKLTLIDASMHMTHNFDIHEDNLDGEIISIGGKEGLKAYTFNGAKWIPAEQRSWIQGVGFGEVRRINVKTGKADGVGTFAGISPMHGNELSVGSKQDRINLTSDLNQGHALATGDLLGSGRDQIVAGWREPNKENKVGVKIYVEESSQGQKWMGYWVDDNGMACEDLALADLDGDGRKDIIAAGRASHNLKVYWNRNGNGK